VHVIIFLGLLPTLAQFFYPGTGSLELWISQQILPPPEWQIPYHDFASEYPPLALLSFLLPGIFTSNTIAYSWVFAAELMICDLLVLLMLADVAATFKVSVRNTLVVYTLFILATGPILIARYDLFPAMLVLAGLGIHQGPGETGLDSRSSGLRSQTLSGDNRAIFRHISVKKQTIPSSYPRRGSFFSNAADPFPALDNYRR
jgi:hypothetical protein